MRMLGLIHADIIDGLGFNFEEWKGYLEQLPSADHQVTGLSDRQDRQATELIDRQAALDCFHDWTDKHGDVHTADEMPEYRRILELPSVQPEIIHCEDCKYYYAGFECLIEWYGIERNKDWFCGDAERGQNG